MAVDAALLEGDPIGAHIPFLDDVHADRPRYCDPNGRTMQRPAVAEQNEITDRIVDDQAVEKLRPLMLAAAEVDRTRKPPECLVAAVEINPVYSVAPRRERLSETREKTRGHPLQE
jgi:hypothetical protein